MNRVIPQRAEKKQESSEVAWPGPEPGPWLRSGSRAESRQKPTQCSLRALHGAKALYPSELI